MKAYNQNYKSAYVLFIKPFFDRTLSLLLLIIFAPFLIVIAAIYLITGDLPIFFNQQRTGKSEKNFLLFKFRTLKDEIHLGLEQRRFAWGSFLRRFSLDELPQLINILKGEMSFIGPRPLPLEYDSLYSEVQRQRFYVLPGITGWAQINGRNSIPWKKKLEYDVYYIQHISWSLDMKIFFKTILLIFSFRPDVSLQEKKFTGKNE